MQCVRQARRARPGQHITAAGTDRTTRSATGAGTQRRRWPHRHLAPRRVAAPAGVTAVLRAVSADSAGDVWTAGDNQGHPVVLRYNGRAWAPVAVPLAGYSDLLQGVKAVSPSDVWAAGLEVVNDTTFQVATLNGVAAASGGSVIAVGSYDDPGTAGPVRRTLVLRWTGSSWTTVPSRNAGPPTTRCTPQPPCPAAPSSGLPASATHQPSSARPSSSKVRNPQHPPSTGRQDAHPAPAPRTSARQETRAKRLRRPRRL